MEDIKLNEDGTKVIIEQDVETFRTDKMAEIEAKSELFANERETLMGAMESLNARYLDLQKQIDTLHTISEN
jgi:hypothetical protein